jgi:hypothetical protein
MLQVSGTNEDQFWRYVSSMTDRIESDLTELRDPIGLCATCRHARVVQSSHGSTFYLCRLAESDPRFSKYPRLPVLRCAGYEAADDAEDAVSHPKPGTDLSHPKTGTVSSHQKTGTVSSHQKTGTVSSHPKTGTVS